MNADRWHRVKEIFEAALELKPNERAKFLDEQCAGDDRTRDEVETLLSADKHAGNFAETPAIEVMARIMANNNSNMAIETSLAHYRVIERLGVGGMGEV